MHVVELGGDGELVGIVNGQAAVLVEGVIFQEAVEALEDVKADGAGAGGVGGGHEHGVDGAGAAGGAGAYMAFVQENNLAGAFVGEVEGGAEAGQAGADDYCARLWHVVVAWLISPAVVWQSAEKEVLSAKYLG